MRRHLSCLLLVVAPVILASCAEVKSATPLSPSIAGPIAGVEVSAPGLVSPSNGAKISAEQQPIVLTVNNATSSGVRPLTYLFEVAADSGFSTKVFSQSGVTQGTDQTSFRLPQALAAERTYYWRSRAEDGANVGEFSSPINFSVFTPVVLGVPGPVSPGNGSTTANNKPTLEVTNASVTGPATQIHYLFEVATDAAMATRVVSADVVAGSGRTSYTFTAELAASTRFYWRARAFDALRIGEWSPVWSFVTPAPVVVTPSPGDPGPITTAPNDQIDMRTVTIALGADFRNWAVTSTLTSVTHIGLDLCTYHTKAGRWPALPFFDTGATVEGNQWFFALINGKWVAGANEWLRPGQTCKGIDGHIGRDNFGGTALQNWTPTPGELLGIAVSTPARAGQQGTAERSNIVLIRW